MRKRAIETARFVGCQNSKRLFCIHNPREALISPIREGLHPLRTSRQPPDPSHKSRTIPSLGFWGPTQTRRSAAQLDRIVLIGPPKMRLASPSLHEKTAISRDRNWTARTTNKSAVTLLVACEGWVNAVFQGTRRPSRRHSVHPSDHDTER